MIHGRGIGTAAVLSSTVVIRTAVGRSRRQVKSCAIVFLLVVIFALAGQEARAQLRPGIVVISVEEYSNAEIAGVKPGDILLSWSCQDTQGEFVTTFDLSRVQNEYLPREPVKLTGLRGQESRTWVLDPAVHGSGIQARQNVTSSAAPKHAQDRAAAIYQKALNAFEAQPPRMARSEEFRSGILDKYAAYYQDYIDLFVGHGDAEHAFQALERLRARTLLETLAAAGVDISRGVAPELVSRKRALQKSLSIKANRRLHLLGDAQKQDLLAALNRQIDQLLAQSRDVEKQIRESSPSYAALTEPEPLTARQVQEDLLDSDTLLLEYFLGKEHSFVFAMTPESLHVYQLPPRAQIESSCRQLYELLRASTAEPRIESADHSTIETRNRDVWNAAASLSQMVLGPAALELQGKRLLIVSDGALQYIPFAALPAPGPLPEGSENPTSLPLVVEHEMVKLPSASVLAVLRQEQAGRTPAARTVAILADPVFDKNDDRVRAKINVRRSSQPSRTASLSVTEPSGGNRPEIVAGVGGHAWHLQLAHSQQDVESWDTESKTTRELYFSRVVYTRREAMAILAVTPAGEGTAALDFDASRATALDPRLAQFRFVHFATHGMLDSERPELSGLVLSLVDERGNQQNGFLNLQDIYNLKLPADMVVLSACETGLGKEIKGEGLIGLTRGFMFAGAGRVVSSLWKVNDQATAELMQRFYRAIEQEGLRPAAALRKAQIEMWKQNAWSHPYFWAAFELQGEWK
ncbi:MAG TPA: CHAT domain-containing protein [Terriglobales bacterium]|jgi:CHAT domain-containing protein|nr:CHAT domain-containing protein [Terriglobales bacterium]